MNKLSINSVAPRLNEAEQPDTRLPTMFYGAAGAA